MSKGNAAIKVLQPLFLSGEIDTEKKWATFIRSVVSNVPLWICFLLAIIVRTWLTIHTHGVITGDEAMVGIQAEHILRGERPIYYYSQPYMGSLEAYIMATIFAITGGPSSLGLRTTTTVGALALIYLTWKFAGVLADAVYLPPRTKNIFRGMSTCLAALPPLFSLVVEMRTLGGYIEIFVVMLWLLLSAFRLTQRWQESASARELILRWVGLGFLLGLGFWIDPLVVYAVLTVVIWLGGYTLWHLLKPGHKTRLHFIKETSLAFTVIPGALVGGAPAFYWGALNHWDNIKYILTNGSDTTLSRAHLHVIHQVATLYATCVVPRIIGGSLPTEPYVTNEHPHLLTLGLIVGGASLLAAVACMAASFLWRQQVLVQLRLMLSIPLLFIACESFIFCISKMGTAVIYSGCGPWDLVGRYATPIIIVLPFFIAAMFSLPSIILEQREHQRVQKNNQQSEIQPEQPDLVNTQPGRREIILQGILFVILLSHFGVQAYAYVTANAGYTFQTSGCVIAPANSDPIINYMKQAHIRYAWATGWIADPLTFKGDGQIIVSEPNGRLLANNNAVLQSDRASIIELAKNDDIHPPLLQTLDDKHVTYHVARFPSAPGFDILVVTPLSRTVTPFENDPANGFAVLHDGCY